MQYDGINMDDFEECISWKRLPETRELKKRRDIVIKLQKTAKQKCDLELALRMEKEKRDINSTINTYLNVFGDSRNWRLIEKIKNIVKEQEKLYESNIKKYNEMIYLRDKYGHKVIRDYDTGELI